MSALATPVIRAAHRSAARRLAFKLSILGLLVSSAIAASSKPSSSSSLSARRSITASSNLFARHGDHSHKDKDTDDHLATSQMQHTSSALSESLPVVSSLSISTSEQTHDGSIHDHGHAAYQHSHEHTEQPHIPTLQEIGLAPIKIPYFPHMQSSGHQHVHSDAPAELELNETKLLEEKGPEPLSYVEWDFRYGLGSLENLRRFASKTFSALDAQSSLGVMAIVDGRFRKLSDEIDSQARKRIADDILSRVGTAQDAREPPRHAWLLVLHVVSAILSCFLLLPLALFLRAASSSLAPLASLVYIFSLSSSLLVSSLYTNLTPRLYPSNAHGRMGWVILWLSIACLSGDLLTLLRHVLRVLRTAGVSSRSKLYSILHAAAGNEDAGEKFSLMKKERILGTHANISELHQRASTEHHHVHFSEHSQFRSYSSDSRDSSESGSDSPASTLVGAPHSRVNSFTENLSLRLLGRLSSPTNNHQALPSASSSAVNEALKSWHSNTSSQWQQPPVRTRNKTLRDAFHYAHVVVTRFLPLIAFGGAYTGLAVYTGSCRRPFINGCMAHGIKGGIFFWYGVLTFARYLGAYADCGWSWNRRPSLETTRKGRAGYKASIPSAEWVECSVIFLYGATNTWMERFGAEANEPYTVKQVQHISIAVMYWFAGTLGLLLETRWVRSLLSFPVAIAHPSARDASSREARIFEAEAEPIVAAQTPPPSYSGSFNPFPALCIGVTGLAMAAHHQDYVYEVEIHMLWGNLLAGFAALRCLTYFFLWLRPPTSVLPSRPPTEALAAFSLACGGLVFMISSEEVSFAAMRNGFGDFMTILCIGVAFICLVFALVAALFVVKAWAVRREVRRGVLESEPAYGDRPASEHRGKSKRRGSTLPPVREDGEEYLAANPREPIFVLGEDGQEETSTIPWKAAAQEKLMSTSPDNLV